MQLLVCRAGSAEQPVLFVIDLIARYAMRISRAIDMRTSNFLMSKFTQKSQQRGFCHNLELFRSASTLVLCGHGRQRTPT